jgi:hypothetical protein
MKLCFRSDEPTGGLGDLFVRTSHRISSYSYSVRRGGLSTRRSTNKVVDRSARSGVFDLCNVPSSHSVNASSSRLAEPRALIVRPRPPGGHEPPKPKVRQLAGESSLQCPLYDPCRLVRKGKQIPSARDAWLPVSSRNLASGWASQPGAWGIPTTGSHRARAQSAVADGARARNRTLRGPWHQRDLRYGPQTAVPQLADHAPYLHQSILYQIPARAAR